jgi:hypothetical protein
MDFDCVYVLSQQADPSSAKNAGKEIAEAGFRLFWNKINRLLMDYQKLGRPLIQSWCFQDKCPKRLRLRFDAFGYDGSTNAKVMGKELDRRYFD